MFSFCKSKVLFHKLIVAKLRNSTSNVSKFTTYKEFGQERAKMYMNLCYICSCLFSHSYGPSNRKYRDVLFRDEERIPNYYYQDAILFQGWVTQFILQTTCDIIQGGLDSFKMTMIKELQIMKGLSKVDNPIISKVDRYKMWAITFSRIYVGVEVQNPKVNVQYDQ